MTGWGWGTDDEIDTGHFGNLAAGGFLKGRHGDEAAEALSFDAFYASEVHQALPSSPTDRR